MRLTGLGPTLAGISDRQCSEVRGKVLSDQVDLTLRLAPFSATAGLALSASVCLYFVDTALFLYGLAFEVVYLSIVALVFVVYLAWCFEWTRFEGASLVRLRNGMAIGAAISGICLGALPVLFFENASQNGQVLIAATSGALLATSICIGFIPTVGILYAAGLGLGCYIALFSDFSAFHLLIAVLLTVYAVFLASTTCVIARLVAMRSVTQFALEEQREVTELLLHDFEENSSDWLWETDADGLVVSPSARFADVAGLTQARLRSRPLAELFEGKWDESSNDVNRLVEALRQQQPFQGLVVPILVGDERRWWSLTAKPIFDREETFVGFRGVGADVTVERLSVERLDYLANYDVVTRLPNRRMFEDAVTGARHSLGAAHAADGGFGIHYIGLSRFAQINATFGHLRGDQLLFEIGQRLKAIIGAETLLARFTGDQFAILAPSSDERTHVLLAERLLGAFDEPFFVDDLRFQVDVRIGLAVAGDAAAADDIIGNAHTAFLELKANDRDGSLVYAPVMDLHKQERAALMGEVRAALERDEFSLNYQPIVTTREKRLIGFEALMRWNNPVRGAVSPAIFIELAEETGTILELGPWALRCACQFAAGLEDRSLSIAVNISTVQIEHSDLFAVVSHALSEAGLDPSRLELEITESALLASTPETILTLERIRGMGVRLSLDDFGTGYSSLSYLRKLPFDKIKIDRSFINDLPDEQSSLSIVRTIVDLGRSLGMATIAEGIETSEQWTCLKQLGCPELQGYLFGKPVAEDEARRVAASSAKVETAAA